MCGQRNAPIEASCAALGCGKPVRTKCSRCPGLVNNYAWSCSGCGAPNPLRRQAEQHRRQLEHVALWSCAHCRCTNDMAIRVCASCMRPKPKFPTAPVQADRKTEDAAAAAAPAEDRKQHTCVVCMDKEVDHVMVPCGHLCVCGSCAGALKHEKMNACPVCRRKTKLVQRVYYP